MIGHRVVVMMSCSPWFVTAFLSEIQPACFSNVVALSADKPSDPVVVSEHLLRRSARPRIGTSTSIAAGQMGPGRVGIVSRETPTPNRHIHAGPRVIASPHRRAVIEL